MSTSRELRLSLRELRVEVDRLLNQRGFIRELRSIWERGNGWREDVVELRLVHPGVLLNLYVEVPSRPEAQNKNDAVAVRSVGHIVGNRFPVLPFASSRAGVTKVVESLKHALPWFDEFSTPQSALEAMRRYGKNPESISYREISGYLSSVGR